MRRDHDRPEGRPSRMPRHGSEILALLPLGAALLIWCVQARPLLSRGRTSPAGPHPWTVAALQQRVVDAPQAWLGRTVQVQGVVISVRSRPDPFTWSEQAFLVDTDSAARLPLERTAENPTLAALRRLPLIGPWLPQPQALVWGQPALYQIQLRRSACVLAQERLCVAAALVDAAPVRGR